MRADPPVPMYRDAERARNTARAWTGLAGLFAVLAALQWLSDDDPWVPAGYPLAALAYASTTGEARRRAREPAPRSDAGADSDR